jgi:hypothetical protein
MNGRLHPKCVISIEKRNILTRAQDLMVSDGFQNDNRKND